MPILSILIPTRERARYLEFALRSCVSVNDANIEIIVSDNASQDGTEKVVATFSDSRIRYVNTGRRVSMRQNFELAVDTARGEYLIMIGDDDAVISSSIIKFLDVLRSEKPDLVRWSPPLYEWPAESNQRDAHLLLTQAMIFGGYRRVSCEKLVNSLYDGTLKSQRVMPSIYHGCISRKLMNEIKERCGYFFGSGIPDCFVSFVGCALAPTYLLLEHPITIAGASPSSNASYQQKALTLFVSEVETDPVSEPLDISSMITPILYLSTLIAARSVSRGDLQINWSRWISRAVVEIRGKYDDPASQIAHIERLRSGVEMHGGVFYSPGIAQAVPQRAKKRKKRLRKFSLGRLRIQFGARSTVLDAVKFIERVASTYAIKKQFGWRRGARLTTWTKLLLGSWLRKR